MVNTAIFLMRIAYFTHLLPSSKIVKYFSKAVCDFMRVKSRVQQFQSTGYKVSTKYSPGAER